MDPNWRRGRSQSPVGLVEELTVPDNLDATMQLLFLACHGDAIGVEVLLRGGVDVNNINLDGRTALHIAACEGHPDVVHVLLSWKANIDARDRWGSTAVADAKCYGHTEIYNLLKSRGAKIPRNSRTPMMVSNPGEIPEYELNPSELQFRKGDEVLKGTYQVAKWNGTKVSVKILDRESYSDQESIAMASSSSPFHRPGTLLLLLFLCISSVVNSQPLASSQAKTLSRTSRSSRLASRAHSPAPNSAGSRRSTSAPTTSTAPSPSRSHECTRCKISTQLGMKYPA